MEQELGQLSDTLIHYEREILAKTSQISELNALLKRKENVRNSRDGANRPIEEPTEEHPESRVDLLHK